jgi:hypothetical protein
MMNSVTRSYFANFSIVTWPVETAGDGTGEYIWPRAQRSDGKWFGFNQEVLATKRSQYLNKVHFRAQYYNDPHDIDSSPIQATFSNTTIRIISPDGTTVGSLNENDLTSLLPLTLLTPPERKRFYFYCRPRSRWS